MSDFDVVLERLVTEPEFAAALAADPDRALAGYRLDPHELELLRTQVGAGADSQHQVEARANQSSLFGMLSPLAGLAGALSTASTPVEGFGPATADAPVEGLGPADADDAPVEGFGPAGGVGGAEQAPTQGLGSAVRSGFGAIGSALSDVADLPEVPAGYSTKVDVDGDGVWDRHTLRARVDGGVDIEVDLNRDGRADFIGHDDDADGLVDVSEYDRDRDGFFEKRMYDDNGDGWMDRSVRLEPPLEPPVEPGR